MQQVKKSPTFLDELCGYKFDKFHELWNGLKDGSEKQADKLALQV